MDDALLVEGGALNSQPSTKDSSMIEVRGLVKSIGPQEILRGVDLTVEKGETLVIIGRSGGGKSVLLKHLIGLMTPDAGEIWIDGENIIGLKSGSWPRSGARSASCSRAERSSIQ